MANLCCGYLVIWLPCAVATLLWLPWAVTTLCCDYLVLWLPRALATLCCGYLKLRLPCDVATLCFGYPVLRLPCAAATLCCGYLVLVVQPLADVSDLAWAAGQPGADGSAQTNNISKSERIEITKGIVNNSQQSTK